MLGKWIEKLLLRLFPDLVLSPPEAGRQRVLPRPGRKPASVSRSAFAAPRPSHPTRGRAVEPTHTRQEFETWWTLVRQLSSGRSGEGLTIGHSISLAKLRLRSLPAHLSVRGDLDLRQCQRLRSIGDGLRVDGDLTIGGRCPERLWWEDSPFADEAAKALLNRLSRDRQCPLERLPHGLSVGGDLSLRSCPRLRELPSEFQLGGGLTLEGCPSLTTLPHPLSISGNLALVGCRNLRALPSTLKVAGDLRVAGLPIRELPRDFEVGGSLILESCPDLKELPEGLSVAKDLIVRGCPVEQLPSMLRVGRHLVVERCEHIRSVPATASVGVDIRFEQCRRFWSLPPDLKIRRSLKLSRCPALRSLPEGLSVPDTLNLRGCTGLTALPRRLSVGFDSRRLAYEPALILCDCKNLRSVPDDLSVTGSIDVAGSGLTDFPAQLESRCRLIWRGVPVRPAVIFRPETLTSDEVLTERNAELRRVMLERIGVGAVLKKADAKLVDEDMDAGGPRRLVEVLLRNRPHRYLDCRCPSTGREYLLRVPPTVRTCRAAAAWLAGFDDASDYRPIRET